MRKKPLLLLADDEADVRALIRAHLPAGEFEAVEAADGAQALAVAREKAPDLLVLDLMLPKMSGLEVCRALKGDPATASLPILMLTARAEEVDRIVGLELGAQDYVAKPFSPRELILRIRNILRRAQEPAAQERILRLGPLALDRERLEASVSGRPLELTATELKLLMLLLERRGRVQSRETLLRDVWGYENVIETRTVDTHIRRLRDKLGKLAGAVETVRGFGYRIA